MNYVAAIGGGGLLVWLLLSSLPCWVQCLLPVVLFAVWWLLIDADLFTYTSLLRLRYNICLPSRNYSDRVCWIIGASSGIGAEMARQLAARGAKVIISARREEELNKLAQECKGKHEVTVVPFDVRDQQAGEKALQTLLKKYDGELHYLFLNAGRSQRSLASETDPAVTRDMFELNVLSLIALSRLAAPTLLRCQGHIIVTSSVAGRVPSPVSSSYSMTKHALQGYFDVLRLEVASEGLNVTTVCPGPVATGIETRAFIKSRDDAVRDEDRPKAESAAHKMTVERCVALTLAGVQCGVDEIWVSPQPVLFFQYASQFLPDVARYLGKRFIGPKRVMAFKKGIDMYDFNSMAKLDK